LPEAIRRFLEETAAESSALESASSIASCLGGARCRFRGAPEDGPADKLRESFSKLVPIILRPGLLMDCGVIGSEPIGAWREADMSS
jgi:hypothetical protein